jgi:hypothetical protein
MGRTILVGDVHGCRAELEELLVRVGHAAGDRVVSVGDTVARGPESAGVLKLLRSVGGQLVRGNHEEKILRWHTARKGGGRVEPLSGTHLQVARSLTPDDWLMIAASPLYLDLPEHDVRVVHAGVVPGLPIERQARDVLLTIRSLDDAGEAVEQAGPVPWGSRYRGPPHIVFGHHAQPRPQLHPDATGIDTGCVYGGSLTAVVLHEGQKVPPIADRAAVLVSVAARRRYFQGK